MKFIYKILHYLSPTSPLGPNIAGMISGLIFGIIVVILFYLLVDHPG